ncbi:peptide ABC transporter ATP-binding protein [Clostridium sp. HMSC19D02]|uniref:ABC transporter ATP-binding protein n=1 Tax=Clostridioides difficile TaxID=1496 RepID=UPI0008A13AA8|nr:ABC transporter ATP-binding protein [Clostridioides difficile]OFU12696.1 peptide ABC transporter ATP-binding protein [Clostridium sp. HMSC19D02]AXU82103.1 oligopeptide ABC transporter ATP-binding protein [Clostridioides difficile]EGT3637900.1 ABC transporter ATP-binding protein [Clostridioides difficile]EGT5016546.1 ABC transporter ATP-binding protein [Clostridioides difficile]EGT5411052.1 ABC transporter ATP-binding protein [Clostridioides difficile]
MNREKILEIKNLKQYFHLDKSTTVKAVDDISFDIYKGEIFGLVGESGSGKSTTGKTIIRLHESTGGEVIYKGNCISDKKTYKFIKKDVNKSMQIIFQDSTSSLNPRMTIADIISEPLKIQGICKNKTDRMNKVYEMLKLVGLDRSYANKYPSDFSGGQRQRIGIARALSVDPEFIIADEPIASLDVSIQAQIVNLFKKLQQEKNLTCLFIAHDLSMVRHISDRIGVMYNGKLVELADSNELYNNPIHPYTKSLLSAIPVPDPRYAKSRNRIEYNYNGYDCSNEKSLSWIEVSDGHFVYSSKSDINKYQQNLKVV